MSVAGPHGIAISTSTRQRPDRYRTSRHLLHVAFSPHRAPIKPVPRRRDTPTPPNSTPTPHLPDSKHHWHAVRIRLTKMRLRPRDILAATLASTPFLLAGCSSTWHPPSSRSTPAAAQGHAAELVFTVPSALDQDSPYDPYFDRRDASLGVPPGSTALQSLAYPGQPAPDLYEQHWITLRRSSDQFIYFDRYPRYDDGFDRFPRYDAQPCPVRRYDRAW